ncbi:sulfotransferase domain-containing protein [Azospirillum sp. SYSU D00513]|uniref:sulfotransferase domain-containing protein n=1 Tax=Azospirillum sp. SYSU D00513 TaxID=2812561 RepID=UPI001A976457|nr:sulfotransferase domain-containing protein [Azospirillum sp. SYSU D00513]
MGGIYWLASYPKSGNTWFRTFLRNLIDDSSAPADINDLKTGGIASSRGWLDEVLGFDTAELDPDEVERLRPVVYRWSLRAETVGYHKIHDAYTHTADGEPLVSRDATLGAVYILRNPLDVAPSVANHNQCSIDEAIAGMGDSGYALCRSRQRLTDQVRQRLLSWSAHVLSWTDAPGLNRLVIRYEDMLDDPAATFTRAARFLQVPDDPARVEKAIRFSGFQELARQEQEKGFRERPSRAARFFRQGRSGGWRDTLTAGQVERIIADHGAVMRRFGYLDTSGQPV